MAGPAATAPSGGGPDPALLRSSRAELLARDDLAGRALAEALTACTDRWLADVFEAAIGDGTGAALVAVGGYGRGELAPGSDLDVLLLHDGRGSIAEVAERVWYPVWDTGLKLGHAVRTVKQALELAADDLDTATSLLDVRVLAGDSALAGDLAAKALAQWRKRSKRWLGELANRVDDRHEKAGEVAFLLEPDVKEGRGGLRDVHALRWAEAARPVLLDGDAAALEDAYEVLLGVRVELHRQSGKANDQLLLERQDDVARALGDPDADTLMGRVATAARTVAWTSDEAWLRIRSSLAGPRGRLLRRDHELGGGLVLREGEVNLHDDVDPAADPVLVLRAAAAAAHAGAGIHRRALDRLAVAPAFGDPWPPGAREALVDLLGAGRDAIRVLEALDQRRLLERILPEWTPVRSRPQRNAYHRFTVDRHLCEAAANAAALVSRVARPDLLLVGTWLHDIGKGYPGDHTEVGMDLIATIGVRMGFPPDDVAVLVEMVHHHLLLADVATRRDIGDDTTIQAVAEAVGSVTTLELLSALTEADSLATGSSAWSPWKAELLAELARRVAHVLRGGQAADVTGDSLTPELRSLLEAGEQVVRGSGSNLVVVTRDRAGLFGRVAGTLALNGIDVLAAEVVATDEGLLALDVRVDARFGDDVDWERVLPMVRRALAGKLALEARLADRSRTYRRAVRATMQSPPRVRIDNHASATATVVEVRAPDGLGVLYRITRALADLDLDIRHAKVATMGHEVVDSFYVRGAGGEKVEDEGHLAELERAILHQLASV